MGGTDAGCIGAIKGDTGNGSGVRIWGIFSWHTLGRLEPIKNRLHAAA